MGDYIDLTEKSYVLDVPICCFTSTIYSFCFCFPLKVTFRTKIYHPNVDEKGQVCLPIISAENWKPATKTEQGLF